MDTSSQRLSSEQPGKELDSTEGTSVPEEVPEPPGAMRPQAVAVLEEQPTIQAGTVGVSPRLVGRQPFNATAEQWDDWRWQLAQAAMAVATTGGKIPWMLIKDADAEMLQDLILSGVNQALDDSRKMAEAKMAPLSGGLSGLGF